MTSNQIITKLMAANEEYVKSGAYRGDVSSAARRQTAAGQKPYAVIITCADSRVIPEAVFGAGTGELFVIRVAGNVIGENETASAEYAVEHLGVNTVVVLGHTNCGAVGAALHGEFSGHVGHITKKIKAAVGDERDPDKACALNVAAGVKEITAALPFDDLTVVGAIYDIDSGKVELIDL